MSNSVEKKQYIWQRRVIGVMVMLLPILSILFGFIGIKTNPEGWWHSISDTYYANSSIIMASIISISAFFFCTYGGYDWKDRLVNLVTGLGLAGLLVFPCYNIGVDNANELVGLFNLPCSVSQVVHVVCALSAFVGIFINCMFIFTLSNGEITEQKKKRNIIYRICAMGTVVATVLIVLVNVGVPMPKNNTWIAEACSLIPCGVAWLIKGESLKIVNDK